jgi:DNA-binding MarR family transcriptional regulator
MSIATGGPSPANNTQVPGVEDFLLALLRLASALNGSAMFSQHGLGLAEWAMLKELGTTPSPLADLSRRTRLSRQRVRILIKELEKKGFVVVAGMTNGDRRGRTIAATEQAIGALTAVAALLNALDLPAKGRGIPRAVLLTRHLLRSLRRTRKQMAAADATLAARIRHDGLSA